ncbi:MAG: IS256 family transposase [Alphaproteobacteria bacterium]|nr:IS256 family transposase [Alphaproteobacteria bacterium]
MGSAKSLRHVEALVEAVMSGGLTEGLLRSGLESVLAAIMEAEVSEQLGAEHGERSDARSGYRNGYRERSFQTALGTSTLQIPKVREGHYAPSFLTAYRRSDDALLAAVAACYHQGVSTRKVESIMRELGVENLKKSQVSEIVRRLDPQVEAFRKRGLGEFPYVWLDARYENVREDNRVIKVAVLVAIGVRRDGMREVLGVAVERAENEAFWDDFIRSLLDRGLTGVKLAISDAHEGLRAAIAKRLPGACWQRCRVHFMRNLGERVSRRHRPAVLALAKTIFVQESHAEALEQRKAVVEALRKAKQNKAADFLESSDDMLTYMHFPREHWSKLHSTNVIERQNRELKRRTRVVSIFPNREALIRLAGALLLEEHEEWTVARRYISERSMDELYTPAEQLGLAEDPTRHITAAK